MAKHPRGEDQVSPATKKQKVQELSEALNLEINKQAEDNKKLREQIEELTEELNLAHSIAKVANDTLKYTMARSRPERASLRFPKSVDFFAAPAPRAVSFGPGAGRGAERSPLSRFSRRCPPRRAGPGPLRWKTRLRSELF